MKKIVFRGLGLLLLLLVAFVAYVLWHNRPLAPNEHDGPILLRARELLADESRWNRDDDRECDLSASTLSLYCALERASLEVAGEFNHRAAALQAVRRAIDAARPGNDYAHRLRDFNNDPEVGFEGLQGVLAAALEELR